MNELSPEDARIDAINHVLAPLLGAMEALARVSRSLHPATLALTARMLAIQPDGRHGSYLELIAAITEARDATRQPRITHAWDNAAGASPLLHHTRDGCAGRKQRIKKSAVA